MADETKTQSVPASQAPLDAHDAELKALPPTIPLSVKWNGKSFDLEFENSDTLGHVKQRLFGLTSVLPKRQKLVGLTKKAMPSDEAVLRTFIEDSSSFSSTNGKRLRVMMIGTPEADIFKDLAEGAGEDVVNDLDLEYSPSQSTDLIESPAVRAQLAKAIEELEIAFINPPRPGKKLLVLDLDYTLFDMKGDAESYEQLKRPHTDDLLAAAYPHYDLVVWSQTSWKWLEIKLTELGLLTNPRFKICFVLDKTCMIRITSKAIDGSDFKHHAKPLHVIWSKLGHLYGPHNTVHVDDLARNFVLNPSNGVKVAAFKYARHAAADQELLLLRKYLLSLASKDSLTGLQHDGWKDKIPDGA